MKNKTMTKNQNFGQALQATKDGKIVAREMMRKNGFFIFERPHDELDVAFIIETEKSIPESVKIFFKEQSEALPDSVKPIFLRKKIKFNAYLCMFAVDGSIVNGWLPSQLDMLSDDWCILD